MRKWMRDRLQRRKKKTPEEANQAAPPPLQPAYFDAEEPSAAPERQSTASLSQPIPSPKWKRHRRLNPHLDLHLGRPASERPKAAEVSGDAAVEVAVDAEDAVASKP